MVACFLDGLDGILVLGMQEVDQVRDEIDRAGDGVGVQIALALIMCDDRSCGAGAEAVGGVGIKESVGRDDEFFLSCYGIWHGCQLGR